MDDMKLKKLSSNLEDAIAALEEYNEQAKHTRLADYYKAESEVSVRITDIALAIANGKMTNELAETIIVSMMFSLLEIAKRLKPSEVSIAKDRLTNLSDLAKKITKDESAK